MVTGFFFYSGRSQARLANPAVCFFASWKINISEATEPEQAPLAFLPEQGKRRCLGAFQEFIVHQQKTRKEWLLGE